MDFGQPWTFHNANGTPTKIQAGVQIISQYGSSPKSILLRAIRRFMAAHQITPKRSINTRLSALNKENVERVKSMAKTEPTASLSEVPTLLDLIEGSVWGIEENCWVIKMISLKPLKHLTRNGIQNGEEEPLGMDLGTAWSITQSSFLGRQLIEKC